MLNEISQTDFDKMLKFGKASNKVAGFTSKRFVELPYGLVKIDLPNMQMQKEPDVMGIVELIFKEQYPEFDISDATGNEIVSFMLWVKSEQEFINRLEELNLSSEPEVELLAAGINEMNQFLGWNAVRALAKEFGKDPFEVKDWEYHKVYLFLKMDTVSAKIDKKYRKIIEEKSKYRR